MSSDSDSDIDTILANSFIDEDEFRYYRKMVEDNYSGSGVIIDGGCFTGASTYALCEGLSKLQLYSDGNRRVVAIDRFVALDPYVVSHFQERKGGIAFGESFLTQFIENLSGHMRCLDVRAGDLVQVGRVDADVEIAVVDIAKSSGLNAFIGKNWYSRMIPGVSFLVHQDFYAPSHPWIAVSMAVLLDHFDFVEERVGEGAVFRLVRPIPNRVLEDAYCLGFNSPEAMRHLERIIEAISSDNAAPVRIMKAMLHFRLGQQRDAERVLEELLSRARPPYRKWEQWLSIAIAAVMPGIFSADSMVARMYADHAAIRLGD